MSARGRARLLAFYPREWRERYGGELLDLLEAEAHDGRLRVATYLDVIRAGLGERLRSCGLRGDAVPPRERVRAGVLLVLSSWAAFVIAGIALQKLSEHWQAVTPAADRGLPRAAFDAVRVAAVLGSLSIVAGVLLVARPILTLIGSGGLPRIRRSLGWALGVTALTAVVLVAVVIWAHHLSSVARNGGDALYGLAFLGLVTCVVGTVTAWTVTAVTTARSLDIPWGTLRRETYLAGATTLAMTAVTGAATVWWIAVAGSPSGLFAPGFPWLMVAIVSTMVTATGLALTGTHRAIRATTEGPAAVGD